MTLGGLVQTFQIARLKGCRMATLQPSGTYSQMWGRGFWLGGFGLGLPVHLSEPRAIIATNAKRIETILSSAETRSTSDAEISLEEEA